MTLDVEALRNSLLKSELTSKKLKTWLINLPDLKKWADFKDFFEKKAEIDVFLKLFVKKKKKKNLKINFWDFCLIYINILS